MNYDYHVMMHNFRMQLTNKSKHKSLWHIFVDYNPKDKTYIYIFLQKLSNTIL